MANVSRPLLALLVGTVAFFAVWMVAFKQGGSPVAGSQDMGTYQGIIAKAHQTVAQSYGKSTQTTATTAASAAAAPKPPATTARITTAAPAKPAPANALATVAAALRKGQVIALLFYNPPAVDDQAVKRELAAVPDPRGRVLKLAVPVSQLASFGEVTDHVFVSASPTLILIDRRRQASTIVGFADRYEIQQRIAQALSAG
jgi:hypothetical protein